MGDIGDPYATLSKLKTRLGIVDGEDDVRLEQAVATASSGIEKFCRRQFNMSDSAAARVYRASTTGLVMVDDFHTDTDLVVESDTGATGTFDTTWDSGDFQVEPLNGIQDGIGGWPYWRIRAVESTSFTVSGRATVRVTARWGWAAVPKPVVEATLVTAEEISKLKDAPFGVQGSADYGLIRVRENHRVTTMLAPYRRRGVRIA